MNEELKKALAALKTESVDKIKELGEKQDKTSGEVNDKIKEFTKQFNDRVDVIEKNIKEHSVTLPGLDEEEKRKEASKKFSFQMCYKGMLTNDWGDAGYEKEVIDSVRKSSNAGTGTAGGFLIPDEVSSTIIDLAIANMPIMQMGITRMTGLAGDVSLPKVTGRPTGFWVGENAKPTESNTTFDQRNLRPKRVAGFTKVSKRLILQSRGTAEGVVRDELSKGIALTWHKAFIDGKGTDNEPKGLQNFGIGTTEAIGTNGGRFTIDKAAQMETDIAVNDMLNDVGSFGWLMHPRVLGGLKRERVPQFSGQKDGTPILMPITKTSELEEQLGHMLRQTTQISATETKGSSSTVSRVYFGDWSQLVSAEWAGMELRASDIAGDGTNSAFLQDELWLIAQATVDISMKDETGFTQVLDAETLESKW